MRVVQVTKFGGPEELVPAQAADLVARTGPGSHSRLDGRRDVSRHPDSSGWERTSLQCDRRTCPAQVWPA